MKAFILAAGLGTRLRPLTDERAKPSLPVVNIPMIHYALHLLREAGVREVMINLHHAPDSIKEVVKRGRAFKMKVRYSLEPMVLGTGGALKNVERFFDDEPFFLLNGDVVCDVDLRKVLEFHLKRDALATMVLREDKTPEKYGVIAVDAEQRIRRFTTLYKDRTPAKDLRRLMFTGIHVLNPQILEYLPPAVEVCINRYAYPRLLENGENVFGYIMETGFWSDLGTPESFLQGQLQLLRQPSLLRHLDPLDGYAYSPRVEVSRIVRMGKDVDLADTAQIKDPVVIADRCVIRKGAIVGPHVILGEDCVVEDNARLSECVVFPGTRIKSGEALHRVIAAGKIRMPATAAAEKPAKAS